MRSAVLSLVLGCAVLVGCDDRVAHAANGAFSYSGDEGPAHWHELPGWEGDHQRHSPIDIASFVSDPKLPALDVSAVGAAPVALCNTGHTLEQEWPEHRTVGYDGREWEVLQFHFHTYSEHQFAGAHADLEMHVVCRSAEELLVVSVMFDAGAAENPFLAPLTSAPPAKSSDPRLESEELLDLGAFLEGLGAHYYTYPGSLTTPPASGIVTWVVLDRHASLSDAQLAAFRTVLGNNFRPVQPLAGRTVRRNF